jgi:hypothetical protein
MLKPDDDSDSKDDKKGENEKKSAFRPRRQNPIKTSRLT